MGITGSPLHSEASALRTTGLPSPELTRTIAFIIANQQYIGLPEHQLEGHHHLGSLDHRRLSQGSTDDQRPHHLGLHQLLVSYALDPSSTPRPTVS